jgi:predicted nucleic acid-binding protein
VTLADTSVWVEHLREGSREFESLLLAGEVAVHPFVAGELALGHLRQREQILSLLDALPQTTLASHIEVLTLVKEHRLAGSGLGYVDAHLLASALLSGAKLMTRDRTLERYARRLGVIA